MLCFYTLWIKYFLFVETLFLDRQELVKALLRLSITTVWETLTVACEGQDRNSQTGADITSCHGALVLLHTLSAVASIAGQQWQVWFLSFRRSQLWQMPLKSLVWAFRSNTPLSWYVSVLGVSEAGSVSSEKLPPSQCARLPDEQQPHS